MRLVAAQAIALEDVSVACVDDPVLLSYCYPSITTMSFGSYYQMTGSLAAEMIIDCIDGMHPDPFEIVMSADDASS